MTELKNGDRVSVKIKSDSLNVFHGSAKETIDYSSVAPDGTNDTSIEGEIGEILSDKNEKFSPNDNDNEKADIFINAIKLINVPFSALTPITNGGAKRKSRRPKKKSKKSKKNKSKRKSRRASK